MPFANGRLGPWLVRPITKPSANLRLICIPFAGTGTSAFRGWSQELPGHIEAVYVHLPGRESRLREPNVPDLVALSQAIANELEPISSQPFAVFGHSLGGLIAFEVVRALRHRGLPMPVRLFVSASRPPQVPHAFPPLRHLGDAELLKAINERYNGSIPREMLECAELRELITPAMRADFTALETYEYAPQPPLACPISIFGGRSDRTLPAAVLDAWSVQTVAESRVRLLDADHFYLQSARRQLIDTIVVDVATAMETASAFGMR